MGVNPRQRRFQLKLDAIPTLNRADFLSMLPHQVGEHAQLRAILTDTREFTEKQRKLLRWRIREQTGLYWDTIVAVEQKVAAQVDAWRKEEERQRKAAEEKRRQERELQQRVNLEKDLKEQRRIMHRAHPDKGGSAEEFRKAREKYESIKRFLKQHGYMAAQEREAKERATRKWHEEWAAGR